MAKTKKQSVIGKSIDELQVLVVDLRKEIGKLSMDNAKRQLKATSSLRTKKDELARALTALRMMAMKKVIKIEKAVKGEK